MKSDILAVNNRYRGDSKTRKRTPKSISHLLQNAEISPTARHPPDGHASSGGHVTHGIGTLIVMHVKGLGFCPSEDKKRPAITDGETVDPLPPSHLADLFADAVYCNKLHAFSMANTTIYNTHLVFRNH